MVEKSSGSSDAIVIKKYANRRLYNTSTSSYVTLDTLGMMVKKRPGFRSTGGQIRQRHYSFGTDADYFRRREQGSESFADILLTATDLLLWR